jgi:hypothetical protein
MYFFFLFHNKSYDVLKAVTTYSSKIWNEKQQQYFLKRNGFLRESKYFLTNLVLFFPFKLIMKIC